jgi:hypothetical protein
MSWAFHNANAKDYRAQLGFENVPPALASERIANKPYIGDPILIERGDPQNQNLTDFALDCTTDKCDTYHPSLDMPGVD